MDIQNLVANTVESNYLTRVSFWWKVEGAASEDGRTPSIWDTFADAGLFSLITYDCTCTK